MMQTLETGRLQSATRATAPWSDHSVHNDGTLTRSTTPLAQLAASTVRKGSQSSNCSSNKSTLSKSAAVVRNTATGSGTSQLEASHIALSFAGSSLPERHHCSSSALGDQHGCGARHATAHSSANASASAADQERDSNSNTCTASDTFSIPVHWPGQTGQGSLYNGSSMFCIPVHRPSCTATQQQSQLAQHSAHAASNITMQTKLPTASRLLQAAQDAPVHSIGAADVELCVAVEHSFDPDKGRRTTGFTDMWVTAYSAHRATASDGSVASKLTAAVQGRTGPLPGVTLSSQSVSSSQCAAAAAVATAAAVEADLDALPCAMPSCQSASSSERANAAATAVPAAAAAVAAAAEAKCDLLQGTSMHTCGSMHASGQHARCVAQGSRSAAAGQDADVGFVDKTCTSAALTPPAAVALPSYQLDTALSSNIGACWSPSNSCRAAPRYVSQEATFKNELVGCAAPWSIKPTRIRAGCKGCAVTKASAAEQGSVGVLVKRSWRPCWLACSRCMQRKPVLE